MRFRNFVAATAMFKFHVGKNFQKRQPVYQAVIFTLSCYETGIGIGDFL